MHKAKKGCVAVGPMRPIIDSDRGRHRFVFSCTTQMCILPFLSYFPSLILSDIQIIQMLTKSCHIYVYKISCTTSFPFSFLTFLLCPFPVLVGNKRMHGRCGCKLVITSQEIALLLLPDSEDEGTPARWRRSSHILTPSHLAGVWGEEQPALF